MGQSYNVRTVEPVYVPEVRIDGCTEAKVLPNGLIHIALFAWGLEDGEPVRVIVAKIIQSGVCTEIRDAVNAALTIAAQASCAMLTH